MSEAAPKVTTRHLFRSSAIVSVMTQLSRVLGMVRDIVLANIIGAGSSPGADAFFLAFKIPNFFRRLFAEGAFAQAFVPVLSEYRQAGNRAAVKALLDAVCGVLGTSTLLLSVLIIIASPWFTILFAPGFWLHDAERYALTSQMLQITIPYLFLITMTGFAGAILNTYDRFTIPAATPILMNATLIVAALCAAPFFEQPVFALAWGVLASGVVQLIFQLPFLKQLQLLPRPKLQWKHEGVQKILTLMVPAMFGVSVSQINVMLDTIWASFLPKGSVAWLYYSERVSELPLGVFGVAVATVILPSMARSFARKSEREFSATLDWALRINLLIGVPAALALMVLAVPILSTLFGHGETTAHDISMSAWAMGAYAFGLVPFMLIKVLAPGFYARQDMKTPVKIGIIAMVLSQVLNVILAYSLHHYFKLGHVGLALSTALAACVNAGMLYQHLHAQRVYHRTSGWLKFSAQLVTAALLMVVCLLALYRLWPDWESYSWYQRVLYLAVMCVAGLGVYGLALIACGVRPRHLKLQAGV